MPNDTKTAKPILPGFTPEEEITLRRAMNRTWEMIASDVLSGLAEEGKYDMPRSHVIEVVLDADYMLTNGRLDKDLYARWNAVDFKIQNKFAKTVFTFSRYS
jgi:hypothetical protein